MRFVAVLNRDGGTLRTIDMEGFCARLRDTIEEAGHSIDIDIVSGSGLIAALEKARDGEAEVVLAGGGDGTISAAAATLMNSGKALAILPAGTMNLFARSLGIPLALDDAVAALASGERRAVDIASANGRAFVHQFSIGMHPRLIDLRSSMKFTSRIGKIGASCKAAWETVRHPPRVDVSLDFAGSEIRVKAMALGITNNLFGEGHLPYAEKPDGGVLGIYITAARQRSEVFGFILNMARGKWRDNDHVDIHQAQEVTVRIRSNSTRLKSAIDGELCDLERETKIEIHPGALCVLTPAESTLAKAA